MYLYTVSSVPFYHIYVFPFKEEQQLRLPAPFSVPVDVRFRGPLGLHRRRRRPLRRRPRL